MLAYYSDPDRGAKYGDKRVLWRRSDTLCISGFMDDVIFAHKPIARRRRPAEA